MLLAYRHLLRVDELGVRLGAGLHDGARIDARQDRVVYTGNQRAERADQRQELREGSSEHSHALQAQGVCKSSSNV